MRLFRLAAIQFPSQSWVPARPAVVCTPEDILLAKLHWFKLGGELSEVQWLASSYVRIAFTGVASFSTPVSR